MSRTYYVIELTPRWLAILLVLLVALVVVAFVGGYGAAWSTLGGHSVTAATEPGPESEIAEVEIAEPETDEVVTSVATPVPPKPTVTPGVIEVEETPTPTPEPTAVAIPVPASQVAAVSDSETGEFWVQIMAVSHREAIDKGRKKVADAGFPKASQRVVESPVAGGGSLFKLWVGPFPDRGSANRVRERMQRAGFPDAWVVVP